MGVKKKKDFQKYGKTNSSRPFLAHPAGRQETTFYLRVAQRFYSRLVKFCFLFVECFYELKKYLIKSSVGGLPNGKKVT